MYSSSFLKNFLEEVKSAIIDYLKKVRQKNYIFYGFPGFFFLSKVIPLETRSELAYIIDGISSRSSSINIGPYKAYIEIKRIDRGEKAIYDATVRIIEKVNAYAKWMDYKGNYKTLKIYGEIVHIFAMRINLRDNLISFAFGMHNRAIGETPYYKPLEQNIRVIKMHGLMNYEQEAGFYAFLNEDALQNIFKLLLPIAFIS